MIAVSNKVHTNKGVMSLSQIIDDFTDADTSEMCKRMFVANRRRPEFGFIAQPNGYWIKPSKPIKLRNQKGKWEGLRDLYFHGTLDNGLRKVLLLNSHDKEAKRSNLSDIIVSPNYNLWRVNGEPVQVKKLGFKTLVQNRDPDIDETASMVYGFQMHLNNANCVSIRLANGGWGFLFASGLLGHVGFWARQDGNPETVPGGGVA